MRNTFVIQCAAFSLLVGAWPGLPHAQGADLTETQPAVTARADPPPALFARSGRIVEYAASPHAKVVLRAFGRVWAESKGQIMVDSGRVVPFLAAPEVRVPTVFSVTPPDEQDKVLAELVVYPDRKVELDKNLVLVAHGTPAWFAQWSHAVGLPVTWTTKNAKLPGDLPRLKEGQQALLILGPLTAGKELADVAKLVGDRKVNVLVLEAEWFGDSAGAVSVAPSQMLAGLSEIAKQKWPKPLKFASHRKPWPGIANRWAWITDDAGLPLVETIALVHGSAKTVLTSDYDYGENMTVSGPITLSYLPWCEQLGRREHADELMLATLKSAANEPQWKLPKVASRILWVEDGPLEAKDRPVLAAVPPRYRIQADNERVVYILDVRGKRKLLQDIPQPSEWGFERMSGKQEASVSFLILGDDKLLDNWGWLKLDREKKRIGRAGVQWLPADELPPSKGEQIRLMLKLTELGVPLSPPEKRENEK